MIPPKKLCVLCSLCLFVSIIGFSQTESIFYRQYLPINKHAQFSYLTSYNEKETILYDAEPIVRYHFYNNIIKESLKERGLGRAFYLGFRPHLRIYDDQSNPVRTPSYRIIFGTQWNYIINKKSDHPSVIAVSFESGHYSNGQPSCFLSSEVMDGTTECDSLYDLISNGEPIADKINRISGNYSTNFSEIGLQYKYMSKLDKDYYEKISHQVFLGYTHFHNRLFGLVNSGGYSEDDIKLYGRHFINFNYVYSSDVKIFGNAIDYLLRLEVDYVLDADPRITKHRLTTKCIFFPFKTDMGIFCALISGRDNYNIRFVDSGTQFQIGLTWTGKVAGAFGGDGR